MSCTTDKVQLMTNSTAGNHFIDGKKLNDCITTQFDTTVKKLVVIIHFRKYASNNPSDCISGDFLGTTLFKEGVSIDKKLNNNLRHDYINIHKCFNVSGDLKI